MQFQILLSILLLIIVFELRLVIIMLRRIYKVYEANLQDWKELKKINNFFSTRYDP